MTLSEQVETKVTNARVSWDVFYVGEHGFGEHLQVVADESGPILKGRERLLEWLKTSGARPQPRDIAFASKVAPSRTTGGPSTEAADPMMLAAQQVLGAQIGRNCPIHSAPMKRIAGTQETGKLSKAGRSYPAFWVCTAVDGCRGE